MQLSTKVELFFNLKSAKELGHDTPDVAARPRRRDHRMKRRAFIAGFAVTTALPIVARARRAMPVIGFLNGSSPDGYAPRVAAFRQGLKEAGYVEGHNVAIEFRWAEGKYDRLPEMAADLVRRKVSLIAANTPAISRPRRLRVRSLLYSRPAATPYSLVWFQA